MQKLHFSILINAPKEKVWHAMLDDKPYREWTATFSPGSYYKGDWSKGSRILFLGPNPETGQESGMICRPESTEPADYAETLPEQPDGKMNRQEQKGKTCWRNSRPGWSIMLID